jgi:hypothetical protein
MSVGAAHLATILYTPYLVDLCLQVVLHWPFVGGYTSLCCDTACKVGISFGEKRNSDSRQLYNFILPSHIRGHSLELKSLSHYKIGQIMPYYIT